MFNQVEIALISNDIAVSIEGKEYEVLPNANANCLVINQLLKQLKISNIEYGFFVDKSQVFYVRSIYSNLELVDGSKRFDIAAKNIFNKKDVYLFYKMLDAITESDNSFNLFVKWDKKIEYFFDILVARNSEVKYDGKLFELLDDLPDKNVLDQRFSVLLNTSYLNKLKTYVAFWKQTYNIEYSLPIWYKDLYNEK